MMYLELIDKIAERDLDWECVHDIVNDAMENLKRADRNSYEKTISELEDYAYSVDRSDAEQIVRGMKPFGEHWSYDDVKSFIMTKGIGENCILWYMVMNMVYNDYYKTAKDFGYQDNADFYFSLARDFVEDEDAEPHKVEKYFL